MKTEIRIVFVSILIGSCLVSPFSDAEDIKERIKARLPVISALKAEGVIGENNKGYLEFLGPNKTQQEVVNAENSDRKTVYAMIAKQQGVSADMVGKRRAVRIAEKAKPGHRLQNPSGSWYTKSPDPN